MAAPKSTPVGERMAALESAFSAHAASDAAAFATLGVTLTEIRESLSDIKAQQNRQKGFIGGIVVVVSAIWGLVAMAVKFLPLKP